MLIGIFLLFIKFSETYGIYGDNDNYENRVVYQDGFYYEELSTFIKKRITGKSYPVKFNVQFNSVSYDDLRYVVVKYYDFEGNLHNRGELIVNKLLADDVVKIFYELYLVKYPINSIKLPDDYNGSDEASMEDNNTSCFNYRKVENSDKLAWHAFGVAIDVNPLFNPYVTEQEIYPSNGKEYADREKEFQGKIDQDDYLYSVFTKYGWKWGGDFVHTKDYQQCYNEVLDEEIRIKK